MINNEELSVEIDGISEFDHFFHHWFQSLCWRVCQSIIDGQVGIVFLSGLDPREMVFFVSIDKAGIDFPLRLQPF
jgi:hypothetical protein